MLVSARSLGVRAAQLSVPARGSDGVRGPGGVGSPWKSRPGQSDERSAGLSSYPGLRLLMFHRLVQLASWTVNLND